VEQDEQGLGRRAAGIHEHSPGLVQPDRFVAGGDSEGNAVVRESPEVLIGIPGKSNLLL
jgi:hypothetical protein